MNRTAPFLLQPAGKDYLWGGNRLKDDFGKLFAMDPLAETWECSTHPDGVSTVRSGIYKGRMLTEVLKYHPEFMGTHPRNHKNLPDGQLPILIKFIDAKKDLSVQVHPNDLYAQEHEQGQLGKSEMWYVLDAGKDTKLVYGLKTKLTSNQLRESIMSGSLEKFLRYIPIRKNDVFYVEAGIIHAIGSGALIVEIQENSNLTYRLYDYNRTERNGSPRELHIEKGIEAANLNCSREPRQPMRVLNYKIGTASELLCRCKYFQVERLLLNTEKCRKAIPFSASDLSFIVLLCIGGCGVVLFEENGINETLLVFKGDCIFVPAGSVEFKVHGKLQMLRICC